MSLKTEALPTVRASVAATVLGISRRQFDRLVGSGVLPSSAPKQYRLEEVVPAYISYASNGRSGTGDLAAARLRLIEAQSRQVEIANRKREGELHEHGDVHQLLARLGVTFAGQLEALPGRVAGQLAGINDPAQIREVLLRECRQIRSAAADEIEAFTSDLNGRENSEAAADENG